MEFPLGLFGIALATVTLPTLSRQAANASMQEFSNTVDWSMKLVVLIAIPAAIGLVLLAEPFVATIFFGGEFTRFDVEMTALILQAFALGLVGFSFVKILAPAYFAREDTRTPVKAGLIALVINLLLSVVLAFTLTRAGYVGTHAGLALAISVAAIVNAWLLYHGLRRDKIVVHSTGWSALLLRFFGANAAMIIAIVWLHRPLDWWVGSGVFDRSIWLGVVVSISAAVYFAALLLLGLRPAQLKLNGNR